MASGCGRKGEAYDPDATRNHVIHLHVAWGLTQDWGWAGQGVSNIFRFLHQTALNIDFAGEEMGAEMGVIRRGPSGIP